MEINQNKTILLTNMYRENKRERKREIFWDKFVSKPRK
jgi:hypothetical protein